ncbi:tetratricopeptide repeat protein [Nostoc sp. NZL]|uniref:tetratricopeptide repeat protein n=1 Tax=Nostoc sp. NZL TaxID=2650612 RepID=UPI0018C47FF6|nr:tetratricopeptide repeat protein [Nostoc sp. NZL]MBG1240496.1 tetratricopeptide repeat protein [Nostoc sp. NZL]
MIGLNLTGKILVLGVVVLMAETTIAQSQPAVVYSARIDSSTGIIFLKRPDWSDFRPVSVGTELNQGDQIKPDKGVRVRVVCPNLSKPFVPIGVPSGLKTICPFWRAIISKAPPSAGTLGGTNPLIPYFITPRHTLLLSSTPTFRWNAIPKATQYTVTLQTSTGVVWQKQVKNNSLVYPGLPPLQLGKSYSLVVKANTGKTSQDEGTSNLDFRVLRKYEAAAIQSEVTKITKLGLNEQVTALMLANLYSRYTLPQDAIQAYGLTTDTFKSYNLSADAIATLETSAKIGKQSTIIYRSLGDIYWQTGLAQKAIDNYLAAIKLAKSDEDLEEKILAQFALGEVYTAIDDNKQAISWYSQAKDGYTLLGDSRRANFLQQQIESLQQQ